jgi:aromatic ring-cleaving dioxygenase
MERSYNVNSKLLPIDFPRDFDAHVYFDLNKILEATELRDKFKKRFKRELFFVGDMIPLGIGPHPLPMFEANFSKSIFNDVLMWLSRERGEFSVLIHPLSGNEHYDHSQGAIWLGESLKLDYSKFDPID